MGSFHRQGDLNMGDFDHHQIEDDHQQRDMLPLDLRTDDFHPDTMMEQPMVEQPVPHVDIHPPPMIEEEPIISHIEEPTPIIHHEEPPMVHHEEVHHDIHHEEPVLLPVPIAAPAPPPPPPCTVHIPVTVHLKGKLAIKMKHCMKCDFSKNIESIGPLKIASLSQLEEKLKERIDKSFKVKKSTGTKKHTLNRVVHHHKKQQATPSQEEDIHKRNNQPASSTVIDFDKLDHLNEKIIFGDDSDDEVTGTKKDHVSAVSSTPGHDMMVRKSVHIPSVFIPSAAYKRGVIISLPKGKAMLKCVVPKEDDDISKEKKKKRTKAKKKDSEEVASTPELEEENKEQNSKVSFLLNPTTSGVPSEAKSITPDVASVTSQGSGVGDNAVQHLLMENNNQQKQHAVDSDVVTLSTGAGINTPLTASAVAPSVGEGAKTSLTRQNLASEPDTVTAAAKNISVQTIDAASSDIHPGAAIVNPSTTMANSSTGALGGRADSFMKVLDKDVLVSLYKMAVHDIMGELQNAKTMATAQSNPIEQKQEDKEGDAASLKSKIKVLDNQRVALEQKYPGIAATLIAPPTVSNLQSYTTTSIKRSKSPHPAKNAKRSKSHPTPAKPKQRNNERRVKLVDTDRSSLSQKQRNYRKFGGSENTKQFFAADESGFFGDMDPSRLIGDHDKDCIEPYCQKQKAFMRGASQYFGNLDSLALAPYESFMDDIRKSSGVSKKSKIKSSRGSKKDVQNMKRESIEVGEASQPTTIVELFGKLPRVPLKITLNPKGPLAKLKEPITIELKPPSGNSAHARAVATTNNPAIAVTIADRIFKDEPVSKQDEDKLQAAYADLRKRTLINSMTPQDSKNAKSIHLDATRVVEVGKRMKIVVSFPKELRNLLSNGNSASTGDQASVRAMPTVTSSSSLSNSQDSPSTAEANLKPKIEEYQHKLDKLKEETNQAMEQLGRLKDPYSDIGQGMANKRHHNNHHHENQGASKISTEAISSEKSSGPDPYADVGGMPARRRRRSLEIGAILSSTGMKSGEKRVATSSTGSTSSVSQEMNRKELYAKVAEDPYATLGMRRKRGGKKLPGSGKIGTRRSVFDQSSSSSSSVGGLTLITHSQKGAPPPTTEADLKSTVDSTVSALQQMTAANQLAPKEVPNSPHSMMLDSLPKFKEALLKINPDTRKRLFEMKPFRFLANMPNLDQKGSAGSTAASSKDADTATSKSSQTSFTSDGHDPYADMGNAVARSKTKYTITKDDSSINNNSNDKKRGKNEQYEGTQAGITSEYDPYAEVGTSAALPSKRAQTSPQNGFKKSSSVDPFADIGHSDGEGEGMPLKSGKKTEEQVKKSRNTKTSKTEKIHDVGGGKINKDPFADIGSKRQKLEGADNNKKDNGKVISSKREATRDPFADIGSSSPSKRSHVKQKKMIKKSDLAKNKNKNKKSNNKRSRVLKHKKIQQKRGDIPNQVSGKKKTNQVEATKYDPFADIGSAVSTQEKRSKTLSSSKNNNNSNKIRSSKRSKPSRIRQSNSKQAKVGSKRRLVEPPVAQLKDEARKIHVVAEKIGKGVKRNQTTSNVAVVAEDTKLHIASEENGFGGKVARKNSTNVEQQNNEIDNAKHLEEGGEGGGGGMMMKSSKSYAKDPYKSIGKVILVNPPPKEVNEDKEDAGNEDSKKVKSKSKKNSKEFTSNSEGESSTESAASDVERESTEFHQNQNHNQQQKEEQKQEEEIGVSSKQVFARKNETSEQNNKESGRTDAKNHGDVGAAVLGGSENSPNQPIASSQSASVPDPYAEVGESSRFWGNSKGASKDVEAESSSKTSKSEVEDKETSKHADATDVKLGGNNTSSSTQDLTNSTTQTSSGKEDSSNTGTGLKQEVSFANSVLQTANAEEKESEVKVDQALAKTEELLHALNRSDNQIKDQMDGKITGTETQVVNQTSPVAKEDPYSSIRHNLPAIKEVLLASTENSKTKSGGDSNLLKITEHQSLDNLKPQSTITSTATSKEDKDPAPVSKKEATVSKEETTEKGHQEQASNFKKNPSMDPYLDVGTAPTPSKRTQQTHHNVEEKQQQKQQVPTTQNLVNSTSANVKQDPKQETSSRSSPLNVVDPYQEIGESISTTMAATKRSQRASTGTPTSLKKKNKNKNTKKQAAHKRSRRALDNEKTPQKKSPRDCSDPYAMIGHASTRSGDCVYTQSQNHGGSTEGHEGSWELHDPYSDLGSKRQLTKKSSKKTKREKNHVSKRSKQEQHQQAFSKLKMGHKLRKDPYADIGGTSKKRRNQVRHNSFKKSHHSIMNGEKRVYLPSNPAVSSAEEEEKQAIVNLIKSVAQTAARQPYTKESLTRVTLPKKEDGISSEEVIKTSPKDPYADIGKRENINNDTKVGDDVLNSTSSAQNETIKEGDISVSQEGNSSKDADNSAKSMVSPEKNLTVNETKSEDIMQDPYLFIGSVSGGGRKRSQTHHQSEDESSDPYADLGTSIGLSQNEPMGKSKMESKTSEAKTINSDSSGSSSHIPLSGVARSLDESTESVSKKSDDQVGAFTSASQSHIGPHNTSDPYVDLKSLKADAKKGDGKSNSDGDKKQESGEDKNHLLSGSEMKTGEMEKAFQVTNNVAKELKTIANLEREIASEKSKTPEESSSSIVNDLEMNVGREVKAPYNDIGDKKRRTLSKPRSKKCSKVVDVKDPYLFIGSAVDRRHEVSCDEDSTVDDQQDQNLQNVLQSADPSNEEFSKLEDKSPDVSSSTSQAFSSKGEEQNKEGEKAEMNKDEGNQSETKLQDSKEELKDDASKEQNPKEQKEEAKEEVKEEMKEEVKEEVKEEMKEEVKEVVKEENKEGAKEENSKTDEEPKASEENHKSAASNNNSNELQNNQEGEDNKEKQASNEKMLAKEERAKMAAKLAEAAYASISGGNSGLGEKTSKGKESEKESKESGSSDKQDLKEVADSEAKPSEDTKVDNGEKGDSKPDEKTSNLSPDENASPSLDASSQEELLKDTPTSTENENGSQNESQKEKSEESKESSENNKEAENTGAEKVENKESQKQQEALSKPAEDKETSKGAEGQSQEEAPKLATDEKEAGDNSQENGVDSSKETKEESDKEKSENSSKGDSSEKSRGPSPADMTDYLLGRLTSDSTGQSLSSLSSNNNHHNKKKGKEVRPKTRHHHQKTSSEDAYANLGSASVSGGKKKHALTKKPAKREHNNKEKVVFHDPYADMGQTASRSHIPRPSWGEEGQNNFEDIAGTLNDDVSLAL